MLAAMPRRKQARRWAKRVGGKDGLVAMRAFQNSASDLALLRARVARGTASDDVEQDQWGLLQNVNAARDAFTPRPPAFTPVPQPAPYVAPAPARGLRRVPGPGGSPRRATADAAAADPRAAARPARPGLRSTGLSGRSIRHGPVRLDTLPR